MSGIASALRQTVGVLSRSAWRLSTLGLPRGDHITRYEMYNRIERAMQNVPVGGRALSISHSEHVLRRIGVPESSIVDASYPEYDLLNLALPDDEFDVIVSDQVLEHIEGNPQRAIDESYRVLKKGGIAIHTTCFLVPYHGDERLRGDGGQDYWRYTPAGLRILHRNYSRIIEADGWGH